MSRSLFKICLKPFHLLSTLLLLVVMVNVYDSVNVRVVDESDNDLGRSMVIDEDVVQIDNDAILGSSANDEVEKARTRKQILALLHRVRSARQVYIDDVDRDWLHIASLIEPRDCEDLQLLILVASSPENVARRHAIRKTWARDHANPGRPLRYRTVFAMGGNSLNDSLSNRLLQESDQYQDMLVGNYVDTYRNLTVKVVHGLTWTFRSCNPKYVLKTDDDCFVDPDILANDLSAKDSSNNKTRLYVGYRRTKSVVVRDVTSRWYVSQRDYPYVVYPPYASGFGYILSSSALGDIIAMAKEQRMFPVEDAYVGVLAARANIPLATSSNFILPPSGNTTIAPILCQRPYVVHDMSRLGAQMLHHQNAKNSRTCRKTNSGLSTPSVKSRASQSALFNHIQNET